MYMVENNVLEFKISVNNFFIMEIFDTFQNLLNYFNGLFFLQLFPLSQITEQRIEAHLHDQIQTGFIFVSMVDFDDIWMV